MHAGGKDWDNQCCRPLLFSYQNSIPDSTSGHVAGASVAYENQGLQKQSFSSIQILIFWRLPATMPMDIFQAWITCVLLNNKISAFHIPLQQHSFPGLSLLKERPWEQVRLRITFICDWRADSSSPFEACSMVCSFGGQDGSNIFQYKVCVLEKQQKINAQTC